MLRGLQRFPRRRTYEDFLTADLNKTVFKDDAQVERVSRSLPVFRLAALLAPGLLTAHVRELEYQAESEEAKPSELAYAGGR